MSSLMLNKLDEKQLQIERKIYLENVVECNGESYYISSLFTDSGYETLVFHYDRKKGIDDWKPRYIHGYRTRELMEEGHTYACTHVQECLSYWKDWLEGNI